MALSNTTNSLYRLYWDNYLKNLINVFADYQQEEKLVDVTLGCEGRFIKAHKLVLSASSYYFQKIFESHTTQLVILLNDVQFKNLQLIVQFIYKGEVRVADEDLQQFLSLAKMLEVKGLYALDLEEKNKSQVSDEAKSKPQEPPSSDKKIKSDNKENSSKATQDEQGKQLKETRSVSKKRKLPSPTPQNVNKKNAKPSSPPEAQDVFKVPRPPNAFMIFAKEWRKKLAVEFPNESRKDISVRLGNMWKLLSSESKGNFYEDAQKAAEEHKLKYPSSCGCDNGPKEAKRKKARVVIRDAAQKLDASSEETYKIEPEVLEIKCEDDSSDNMDDSSSSIFV